jgi:hypothetical protein
MADARFGATSVLDADRCWYGVPALTLGLLALDVAVREPVVRAGISSPE